MQTATTTRLHCHGCGHFTEDEPDRTHNEWQYCVSCYDYYIIICHDCEETEHKSNASKTNEGNVICKSCYENDYFTCRGCHIIYRDGDEIEVDGHNYCESCYNDTFTACQSCEDTVRMAACYTHDDEYYCGNCFSEEFSTCNSCENSFHNDDMNYSDEDDCNYCHDCYNGNGNSDPRIHDYNYRPRPFHVHGHKASETTLTAGFELEVESMGNSIENAIDSALKVFGDFIYFMHDGSLSHGFEIASHPFTFTWIRENKKKIKALLDGLKNAGLRSFDTKTCGIHIHMNKKSFSTTHLLKFLEFFYKNAKYITKISQRGSSERMNEWSRLDDGGDNKALMYKARTKSGPEKYTAVNLSNPNTIELRIFRGNLHYPSFMKNLEFAQASYEYTKQEGISTVSTDRFNDYVKTNYQYYPNLWNFIRAKNLIEKQEEPELCVS